METVSPRTEDAASVTVLDQVFWSRLADASAWEAFATAWLALQCRMLDHPLRAVLLVQRDGAFQPAARWPEGDAGSTGLADIADIAHPRTPRRRPAAAAAPTAPSRTAGPPISPFP